MYAVTGASGHLGRLSLAALLDRAVPAGEIAALVRDPGKVADFAERGVVVREADYSRPETLAGALSGVDTLLLISGSDVGQRLTQHLAVIEAAKAQGVSRIVYTSILHADSSTGGLAPEHLATEEALAASGLEFTVLRNAWYFENYLGQLGQWTATGEIVSAAGDTPFGAAARSDYAAAAAAAMTSTGHAGAVYELAGAPITMADLAGAITGASGTEVEVHAVSDDELRGILTGAGVPAGYADVLVDIDRTNRVGELSTDSDDLLRLVGRPLVTLDAAVQGAVADAA